MSHRILFDVAGTLVDVGLNTAQRTVRRLFNQRRIVLPKRSLYTESEFAQIYCRITGQMYNDRVPRLYQQYLGMHYKNLRIGLHTPAVLQQLQAVRHQIFFKGDYPLSWNLQTLPPINGSTLLVESASESIGLQITNLITGEVTSVRSLIELPLAI